MGQVAVLLDEDGNIFAKFLLVADSDGFCFLWSTFVGFHSDANLRPDFVIECIVA